MPAIFVEAQLVGQLQWKASQVFRQGGQLPAKTLTKKAASRETAFRQILKAD